MSWIVRLLPLLKSTYSVARRSHLLASPVSRRLYVHAYFFYKRHFEDPFDGLVRTRPDLFADGVILDVGANIGYTCSLFRSVISPGFRIFAFEPDPDNLELLNENIDRCNARGIIVPVAAAVGDTDGMASLWRNPRHPGDHHLVTPVFHKSIGESSETISVKVCTLDGFLRTEGETSPVAFVKIDVQGTEPAVCRGMNELLRRSARAVVAIEYAPQELRAHGFDPDGLIEFFRTRGYHVHLLAKDGSFQPASEGPLEAAVQHRGYVDLLFSRRPLGA
jgi:FkbM family methyltransferase